MKFPSVFSLETIAAIIDAKYVGSANFPVEGMNEIHVVNPGDIVFVDHPKYYDKALQSAATIVLINKEVECPENKALLISEDPFRDFNKLTAHFKPFLAFAKAESQQSTIHDSCIIHESAVVGSNVSIGAGSIIYPNVVLGDDTVIGESVIVQAGTVLGGNAFYYKKRDTGYDRLLSGGRVVLEDNVELGTNCTIDRGVTGDTTIGKGSKFDNQVQIGHDTVIGERVLIASQTGIAGCVVVGNDVTIWGQVGITSGITIGDKAVISAKAGVSKSLEGHKSYFGIPADDFRTKYKEIASIRKIPELIKKLDNFAKD
ncbi:MAG: LpxD N-terminal domain-containing protein [Nonlabens sp.]